MFEVLYLLVASIEMAIHGRHLGLRYQLSFLSFSILGVIALAIQMQLPRYVLLSGAIAVSCLIMQLSFQNPQLIEEARAKEIAAREAAEDAERETQAQKDTLSGIFESARSMAAETAHISDELADSVAAVTAAARTSRDKVSEINVAIREQSGIHS